MQVGGVPDLAVKHVLNGDRTGGINHACLNHLAASSRIDGSTSRRSHVLTSVHLGCAQHRVDTVTPGARKRVGTGNHRLKHVRGGVKGRGVTAGTLLRGTSNHRVLVSGPDTCLGGRIRHVTQFHIRAFQRRVVHATGHRVFTADDLARTLAPVGAQRGV